MLQFVCLFCPACLSMLVYFKLRGEEKRIANLLALYGSFVLLDTTVVLGILRQIKSEIPTAVEGNLNDPYTSLLFLVMGVIVAIVMGYLAGVLGKWLRIRVEEQHPRVDQKDEQV
ncbi:MAG: hypothetical protein ACLU6B_11295 [Lachnospirales bacterium]